MELTLVISAIIAAVQLTTAIIGLWLKLSEKPKKRKNPNRSQRLRRSKKPRRK